MTRQRIFSGQGPAKNFLRNSFWHLLYDKSLSRIFFWGPRKCWYCENLPPGGGWGWVWEDYFACSRGRFRRVHRPGGRSRHMEEEVCVSGCEPRGRLPENRQDRESWCPGQGSRGPGEGQLKGFRFPEEQFRVPGFEFWRERVRLWVGRARPGVRGEPGVGKRVVSGQWAVVRKGSFERDGGKKDFFVGGRGGALPCRE